MKYIFALLLFATAALADLARESGVEGLRAAYARKKGEVRLSESTAESSRAALARASEKVTPVQKVIQLMQGMLEKGKKEKAEEEIAFSTQKQFCDQTAAEKQNAIAEANEKIETLNAKIQKYDADAAVLDKEVAAHDEDVAVWTGDIKAATNVRDVEKADYDEKHKDLSESVDALDRAIAVLKKQSHDKKQAGFIQVANLKSLSLIPEHAKRAIDLFLQQDPEASLAETESKLGIAAPEANAYEFQSQGIVDMLQKLEDKFVDELTALEKEESEASHAFDMLKSDLEAQIEQATASRNEKVEIKAKKMEAKADAKGQLQDTTSNRDEDAKYLSDLTATCSQKASDFADRQQLRAEEIAAIEKAIEIISGDAVSGAADKHLPGFVQIKKTSLAQLRASDYNPAQEQTAVFLKEQASRINSRVLSALAVRVEADPFKKVIKMIKDLIVRLEEEAAEEAEHKGWCDKELATNEQTRKEKTEAIETLHAEIDEMTAKIAKIAEEITAHTEAIATLDADVAKATQMRQEEKAKNTDTVADAKEAQEAVAQALSVLKEFYAKAAEATALVQRQEPFKGNQDAAGGVVAMLEVIASDFARLEAETSTAEEMSAKEYDQFMHDSELDKAMQTKDIEYKTKKKESMSQDLLELQNDLDGTQKELDAALAYYDKLKPTCLETGITYEERVAMRKEEIQSLQEALQILNGEMLPEEVRDRELAKKR